MAVGDQHTQKHPRKMPSFSSSLLDAIYHSIDDHPRAINDRKEAHDVQRRNNAGTHVEHEIESLRRAIRIEKWIENHTASTTPRHLSSNSCSSTDSSVFSSSETDSSSVPRPSNILPIHNPKHVQTAERPKKVPQHETRPKPKLESRFTRTKSRALKIYGDLKKVKEPISPGGKIANFFNSIFSPRNLKKNQVPGEEWGPVRKSRSMKDMTTTPSSSSSLASRSCLNKNPNKSKRSVRFCPVSVIVDEYSQPCGKKAIYDHHDEYSVSAASVPNIGKKNMDSSLRRSYDELIIRECCEDDKSCASSSDLFELENIGRVGYDIDQQELPVYGTTSVKMNKAIASGFIM